MLKRSDVEAIAAMICPTCREGKATLRQREDDLEWVHDRKESHGQATTTHYHSYCLASEFRNSTYAKDAIDG